MDGVSGRIDDAGGTRDADHEPGSRVDPSAARSPEPQGSASRREGRDHPGRTLIERIRRCGGFGRSRQTGEAGASRDIRRARPAPGGDAAPADRGPETPGARPGQRGPPARDDPRALRPLIGAAEIERSAHTVLRGSEPAWSDYVVGLLTAPRRAGRSRRARSRSRAARAGRRPERGRRCRTRRRA